MKTRSVILVVLVGVVLLLAACASLQQSRDDGNVQRIARLINEGRAAELTRMSAVPFLLDQEIVVLPRDVDTFWSTIIEVGFKVLEPALEAGERVGPDSYKQFYDSMEVRTYFKKYLKKSTRLLALGTGSGQRMLLLVRDSVGHRTIYGFKGPY
jgi:hypothetical protein